MEVDIVVLSKLSEKISLASSEAWSMKGIQRTIDDST
jgi:hypothetical protein